MSYGTLLLIIQGDFKAITYIPNMTEFFTLVYFTSVKQQQLNFKKNRRIEVDLFLVSRVRKMLAKW